MVGSKTFVAGLLVVFCLCGAVYAQRRITSMDDFFSFAKDMTEMRPQENVILDTDLDFADTPLYDPLGSSSDGCSALTRDFNGNGHVVKNLKMKNKDGAALFCSVFYGAVRNLIFDESCEFTGDTAAAISVAGTSPYISNVVVSSKVTGTSVAGGFIGVLDDVDLPFFKPPIIHMEMCENNAEVNILAAANKTASVGGFIGSVNFDQSSRNFSIYFENNFGEFDIYVPKSDADVYLGDVIGSMEKSINGHLILKGNKISATSHTGKCKSLTSGGLIGRITSSPNFIIDDEYNSYHHTNKGK